MVWQVAASLAGDAVGGFLGHKANEDNKDIALKNFYAQQRAQRAALNRADAANEEAKLGVTDAMGNRTYFIPGVGWTTDLSPQQQAIASASQDEQLRQLTLEAARNERTSARADDRRTREDQFATEADREFSAARRPNQEALRQLLLARGAESRNAAADRAGEMLATSALRKGGGNAAAIAQGARAASDQAAARQAGIEAELQARGMAQQEFAQSRDAPMQLYDYFRKMSTGGTQAPATYLPTGPTPQAGYAANAASQAFGAAGQAPQQSYTAPNYALTDALTSIGGTLGSYFKTRAGAADDEKRRTDVGGFN